MGLPKRKNLRLQGYDYSQAGYYFITICTHLKKNILCSIDPPVGDGFHAVPHVELTTIGLELHKTYNYIGNNLDNIKIDKFVIMPNHTHAIITIDSGGHGSPPLHEVVKRLKTYTTRMYNDINKTTSKIMWQRSYHDHVIRNEAEYREIWSYIDENPIKWQNDCYYLK